MLDLTIAIQVLKEIELGLADIRVAFYSSNETKCTTSMINKNKRAIRKMFIQKNRDND
jgi:hypothetical protein